MKIVKENYESYIKRKVEKLKQTPLASLIKNNETSYYEILDEENNYVTSFEVFDSDNNWLAINFNSKDSILNDEKTMNLLLSEMKKNYKSLVLRIAEEFQDKISLAKKYGFLESGIKKQGNYNYVELKIEF